jgi:hypothetical protein
MNAIETKNAWNSILRSYTEQNKGRPTRLGIFEQQTDVYNDYWLEDGLPFTGIDVDTHDGLPTIEILLGDYTHVIPGARSLKVNFDVDNDNDGLDIVDSEGKTTILRFEKVCPVVANGI